MKKSAPPLPPTPNDAPTKRGPFSALCRAKAVGRPSAVDAEALNDYILDAGWALLLEQGFERFSFDRLARSARIGKPTIYARYANKEELLYALLVRQIERRQQEIMSGTMGHKLTEVFPSLAVNAVLLFQSAEGRLIDRLIDWMDHETDGQRPSLREWAIGNALNNAAALLNEANSRGEVNVQDVQTAARFFVEGVAGRAKISNAETSASITSHQHWAEQLCAIILGFFDFKRQTGSPR